MRGLASAQALQKPAPAEAARADGHPDLTGLYIYAIDLAPAALKKEVGGKTVIETVDHSAGVKGQASVPNALPSTPRPSYKPELQAKVKDLADHESKTDPVFYCARPGSPHRSTAPDCAASQRDDFPV